MDYEQNYYGYGYGTSPFEQAYRCYPVSFIEKPNLENGDKIIMPPSALNRLASLHIDYPMLFELHNPAANRVSHCGVMEFIADEGIVYLPQWMMENMHLHEGDVVHLKNASLSKGTYVKLQPHTKNFLDISNPKAILETTLRNFSCLTVGDTIMMPYNNKKYYVDIIEAKPSNAVCVIETDCEVDFAPPLDYIEPEKPAPVPSLKAIKEEEATKEDPKLVAFSGIARRLDGKPSSLGTPTPSPILKSPLPEITNRISASSSSSRSHSGKLVFGSNVGQPPKVAPPVIPKDTNADTQKKDEEKFQAFTGKKYSLRG